MDKKGFSDYVFEELSVQIDMLKHSASFHIAGHRIPTPQETGIHVYDSRYRRFSLPVTPVPGLLGAAKKSAVAKAVTKEELKINHLKGKGFHIPLK